VTLYLAAQNVNLCFGHGQKPVLSSTGLFYAKLNQTIQGVLAQFSPEFLRLICKLKQYHKNATMRSENDNKNNSI
jgi:hypothetical protein